MVPAAVVAGVVVALVVVPAVVEPAAVVEPEAVALVLPEAPPEALPPERQEVSATSGIS